MKMLKTYKTTEAHFKLFKAECKRWIEKFGLTDWEIHFEHGGLDEGDVARCTRNVNSRIAKLSLCEEWPEGAMDPLNNDTVAAAAFEETCHVLLYGLSSCAYARFIMEHEIEEAEHALIRRLEHAVWKPSRERKK